MMRFKFFVFIFLTITTYTAHGSLIENFLNGAKSFWPRINDISSDTDLKKLPHVEFELPIENDFIKQGLEAIKAPKGALDVCSHRVIMNLQKNCNQLTLEEVGKLAIMLMNCQLQVENRPKLPCKPEMTLQQCTMGMDQNSYQIYSIMTHRAISICSALKHDQFRMLTEITVNRLTDITQSHTTSLNEALKNQRRINEMGIENIREYEEFNEKIKEGQHKTMEELSKASEIIDEMHTKIIDELEIQKKTELQMQAMEKTSSEISHHLEQTNRQMIAHYQEALDFLDNFKSMMDLIAKFSNNIQNSFEKFRGIMREIGIDITAEFFVLLSMNLGYFIFGMILIIFLDLNSTFKHILIGLSIFNVLASYYKTEVSIFGTNALTWMFYVIFYQVLPVLTEKFFNIKMKLPSLRMPKVRDYFKMQAEITDSDDDYEELVKNNRARSSTPIQNSDQMRDSRKSPNSMKLTIRNESTEDSEMAEIYANQQNNLSANQSSSKIPIRAETPNTMQQRPITPAMLRVLQSETSFERSGTPFLNQTGRIQCQAKTTKGLQCKNAAERGAIKCRVHNY